MNENRELIIAIEAHVAKQQRRVEQAAARGDDLPDSFPLDPEVFQYLYPRSKEPAEVKALLTQIKPPSAGVYRGSFLPGVEHFVIDMPTDGDQGTLCVLDSSLQLVACACRRVQKLHWITLEELMPYAREAKRHPALFP